MRFALLLLFCVSTRVGFSQTKAIYLQYFVKKDTLQLRWAPTNADLFIEGLQKGYEIKRTDLSNNVSQIFTILPFNARKAGLMTSSDTSVLFMTSFVDEFIERKFEVAEQKQAPYFMLNLAASTSRGIANVSGLYFEDVSVTPGSYSYEIRLTGATDFVDKIEVNTAVLSVNPECSALVGSSRIDLKEAYLTWEAKRMNKDYGGYWLLKSQDGKNFIPINTTPLYFLTSQYEPNKTKMDFVDTAVAEGKTYYYKLQPINHFADWGPASEITEVYIQKRLNGLCVIDTVRADELTRVISGHYTSKTTTDEIGAYILYRADKMDGEYKALKRVTTAANEFLFVYEGNLLSGDRHYFKVVAFSADGDSAVSYPYYYFSLDQEPPAVPSDLAGVISEKGVAKLSWKSPPDTDLQGYRVFRANSLKEEFVEVTKRIEPGLVFYDTLALNNLTSEIYYRIRAVDVNFNNSELTAPILLLKPDTIAPVASIFTGYELKPAGVVLVWANSQSEDLTYQAILRADGKQVDTLFVFKNEVTTWVDTSCRLGATYTYSILCKDKTGNKSFSELLPITYELGYRETATNLVGVVNRKDKKIVLTWDLPSATEIYSVAIYKAKNNGSFSLCKTLLEDFTGFEDTDLSPNNTYTYRIKVLYKSGHSSKMSAVVEVVY
jgi:hypothetical protein